MSNLTLHAINSIVMASDTFATKCRLELIQKISQGVSGWESMSDDHVLEEMDYHIKKKNFVGVANYAMFMDARK